MFDNKPSIKIICDAEVLFDTPAENMQQKALRAEVQTQIKRILWDLHPKIKAMFKDELDRIEEKKEAFWGL